jgi:myo-inositol-1(or 4)-monophosphatase
VNLARLSDIASSAADLAAGLLTTQQPGRLTAKGDRDYASEVDFRIEWSLRRFLGQKTPHIGFVGEEFESDDTAHESWWALDPIDGTVNFAHDLPLCGISLGLIHRNRPVLGVIDLPFLHSRYLAIEGSGAWRNGRVIQVSRTSQLADALVTVGDYAVGPDADDKNQERLQLTQLLAGRVLRIRMLGSAALDLAWLAEGKTDASIALSNRPWDVAAGVIVAREAGAVVSDLDGSDHTTKSQATIASCPGLDAALHELIRSPIGPQRSQRLDPGDVG